MRDYKYANNFIEANRSLSHSLVDWFFGHARVLPWRNSPTPYHVWVSEIMLQQTRVEAVKRYYERFMDALPDVADLAACPEDLYHKLWEGLGYYSRVRNLNAAAKQVMDQYAGQLPADYESLLSLKGIGSYTAGAIASTAFGQPYPAVDGNALRVLTRLMGLEWDIADQKTKTAIESLVKIWLLDFAEGKVFSLEDRKAPGPGVLNQALMELGATVCLPNKSPNCGECPWKESCVAHKENTWDHIPVRKKAKERRVEKKTVFLLRNQDGVYFHKRGPKGLLAGLYELPNVEGWLSQKEALSFLENMGYLPIRIKKLEPAKHIFSHIEWHMHGYEVILENPVEKETGDWFFVDVETARKEYAIPSAFKAYRELL